MNDGRPVLRVLPHPEPTAEEQAAAQMREARRQLGLSRVDMADMLLVRPGAIVDWEEGRRAIPASIWAVVCERLDSPPGRPVRVL